MFLKMGLLSKFFWQIVEYVVLKFVFGTKFYSSMCIIIANAIGTNHIMYVIGTKALVEPFIS